VAACCSLSEIKGLRKAPHEQGCEFMSWKVQCKGVVSGKRQKGRLLSFLSLTPGIVYGAHGEVLRVHSWTSATGDKMEVQAVCGQTLASELGDHGASTLLKSIKVGQKVNVTGYPRRNRGKIGNKWALEINTTAVEVVEQPQPPAPVKPSKRKKSNHASLPEFVSAVAATFVNTPEALRQVLQQFREYTSRNGEYTSRNAQLKLVGIDCEWRPRCHGGGNAALSPVSVLQLAIPTKASIVLDLLVLTRTAQSELRHLAELLQQCVIVGFGLHQDLTRLAASYPDIFGLFASGVHCLDIQRLTAIQDHIDLGQSRRGLASLAALLLKRRVDKKCQTSDWGSDHSRLLSVEQIEYAATDVAILTPLLCATVDSSFDFGAYVKNEKIEYENVMQRFSGALSGLTVEHTCSSDDDVMQALPHSAVIAASRALGIDQVEVGTTVELQEKLSGQIVEVAKTVALQLASGSSACLQHELVVCVCSLNVRLSIPRVARALGVQPKQLRLLCADELVPICGFPRGAIGPLGLRQDPAATLIDQSLSHAQIVLCGAGALALQIALPMPILCNLPGSLVAHINTNRANNT